MAAYSFKREANVYVVYASNQYNIDISEITFSQTFMEQSIPVKTIQIKDMFEASIIRKANPANFSITFPAIREDDFEVIFDRALDYATFDIFVETPQDKFKITKCVITDAFFVIETSRPLTMTVTGEATRVTRVGSLEGSPVARDVNRTYNRISDLTVTLDSVDASEGLASISAELKNNITWLPYMTLDAICSGSPSVVYPVDFTIAKRTLSGTLTNYLTDTNNADLLGHETDVPFRIQAGQDSGGTIYGFDININNCFFTNRLNTGSIFTQTYDWHMIENPASLSTLVSYVTL